MTRRKTIAAGRAVRGPAGARSSAAASAVYDAAAPGRESRSAPRRNWPCSTPASSGSSIRTSTRSAWSWGCTTARTKLILDSERGLRSHDTHSRRRPPCSTRRRWTGPATSATSWRRSTRPAPPACSVLCLPELCITGYGCEDAFHSPGLQRTALDVLARDRCRPPRGMIVSPRPAAAAPATRCSTRPAWLVDGRIAGFVAKRFLAGDGLHYEPRWFKPWPQRAPRRRSSVDGQDVPDRRPASSTAAASRSASRSARTPGSPSGPAASMSLARRRHHPQPQRQPFRLRQVRGPQAVRARRLAGVQRQLRLRQPAGQRGRPGHLRRRRADRLGRPAAGRRAAVLASPPWHVTTRRDRRRRHAHEPRPHRQLPARSGRATVTMRARAPSPGRDVEPEIAAPQPAAWETGPHVKEEEFTRAVALGLFDYLRKSRSRGFVVSLSGGADSSAVACLVALMVELAVAELGRDGFCASPRATSRASPSRRRIARPRAPPAALRLPGHAQQQPDHARRRPRRGRGPRRRDVLRSTIDDLVERLRRAASSRRSAASSPGRPTTSPCRTSRPACARRASGCWPTSRAPCCWRPATAARRPSATPRWTATPAAASAPIAGIDKAFLRQLAALAGDRRARRASHPIPALAAVNELAADRRAAPAAAEPDRRRRPDALRRARRHRAGGHPRQAAAARGLPPHAAAVPAVRVGAAARCGSSGSSASGAATSGSASATPRRSTSTTRTSTPRPGAASRSSPAASTASWPSSTLT